jgi:hypothetical protein
VHISIVFILDHIIRQFLISELSIVKETGNENWEIAFKILRGGAC